MKLCTLPLLVLLAGCAPGRSPFSSAPRPFLGTWVGLSGIAQAAFTFNADGTYTAGIAGMGAGGRWREEGGQLLLKPEKPNAQPERPATWSVSEDGKTLTLTTADGPQVGVIVLTRQNNP